MTPLSSLCTAPLTRTEPVSSVTSTCAVVPAREMRVAALPAAVRFTARTSMAPTSRSGMVNRPSPSERVEWPMRGSVALTAKTSAAPTGLPVRSRTVPVSVPFP